MRELRGSLDFSPEEYDRLEERLSQLRRLEKKYSADEAGLASLLEESRKRLDELEAAEEKGKRPYQKILLTLGSALLGAAVGAL